VIDGKLNTFRTASLEKYDDQGVEYLHGALILPILVFLVLKDKELVSDSCETSLERGFQFDISRGIGS
jgi:hypothetical protein